MWGDDRDHAASAEHEPVAFNLPDGVRRFFPDLGTVPKNNRALTHPSADDPAESFLRF